MLRAAGQALVRPLEDDDLIGHDETVKNAAYGQRAAAIQTEQHSAGANVGGSKVGGRGLGFDDHGDIGHAAAEAVRDFGTGACDQAIEVGSGQRGCPEMGLGLFFKFCFFAANGLVTLRCTVPVTGIALGGRSRGQWRLLLFYGEPFMGIAIAIDGPAGAGKSTIARRLAARLGFTYIDSGAMYRAVALWAIRQHADSADMHRMEQLARAAEIELEPAGTRVLLNSEDVTAAIRAAEVGKQASVVAAIPGVRRALVEKQRALGARTSVVMEGRDIGTVVFPQADVKIFLDANPGERVSRRVRDFREQGEAVPPETIAAQIHERDQRDRTRLEAPLIQAPDAVYIDSTALSPDQVEEEILKVV